jgi:arsenate reductase
MIASNRRARTAMDVVIYHNPKCSKSRQALELLRERGIEPRIVEYLKTPPSARELDAILKKLGIDPRALLRTKEAAYEQAGLGDPALTRAELIAAMVENPIVIERPIVVKGERAAVGRPPEKVLEIL